MENKEFLEHDAVKNGLAQVKPYRQGLFTYYKVIDSNNNVYEHSHVWTAFKKLDEILDKNGATI